MTDKSRVGRVRIRSLPEEKIGAQIIKVSIVDDNGIELDVSDNVSNIQVNLDAGDVPSAEVTFFWPDLDVNIDQRHAIMQIMAFQGNEEPDH